METNKAKGLLLFIIFCLFQKRETEQKEARISKPKTYAKLKTVFRKTVHRSWLECCREKHGWMRSLLMEHKQQGDLNDPSTGPETKGSAAKKPAWHLFQ